MGERERRRPTGEFGGQARRLGVARRIWREKGGTRGDTRNGARSYAVVRRAQRGQNKTMAGAGAGAKTRFGVVGLERGWRCTASELASLLAARPTLAFGLGSGGACVVWYDDGEE